MTTTTTPIELSSLQVNTIIPATQGAFFKYFQTVPAGLLKGMFGVTELNQLWTLIAKFYLDENGALTCLVTNTHKSNSVELTWDHHTQSWDDGSC